MHNKQAVLQAKILEMQQKIQKIMHSYKRLLKKTEDKDQEIVFLKEQNKNLKGEIQKLKQDRQIKLALQKDKQSEFRSQYLKNNQKNFPKYELQAEMVGLKKTSDDEKSRSKQEWGFDGEVIANKYRAQRNEVNQMIKQNEIKKLTNSKSASHLFSQTTPIKKLSHLNPRQLFNTDPQNSYLQHENGSNFEPITLRQFKNHKYSEEPKDMGQNRQKKEKKEQFQKRMNSKVFGENNKNSGIGKSQISKNKSESSQANESEAAILRELWEERDKEIRKMEDMFANINKRLEGIQ